MNNILGHLEICTFRKVSSFLALLAFFGAASLRAQLVSLVPPDGLSFNNGNSVASDSDGNVYVLETSSGKITRINTNGTSTIFAGGGPVILSPVLGVNEAEAFRITLNGAQGMRFGPNGVLYVSDTIRNRIISITREPNPFFEGAFRLMARIYAGDSIGGYGGDGDLASLAKINQPGDIAFDNAGNMYLADMANFRVRRIGTDGIITTVAGNGVEGFSGDGGAAIDASIEFPRGLVLDSQRNLYISMYDAIGENSRIRKVNAQGIISTIAGSFGKGFSGEAGFASAALLNSPIGLAVDSSNTLYVADSQNHRVRIITPTQRIYTIVGTGEASDAGVGGQALSAGLNNPRAISFDPSGNLLISDVGNFRVLKVSGVANAPRISFDTFSPSTFNLIPGGLSQKMDITITRFNFTGSVGFNLIGIPGSVSGGAVSPGAGSTGSVVLSAVSTALIQSTQVALQASVLGASGEILSAITVNIPLNIVPVPTLTVNPTSLSFNAIAGGPNPSAQNVSILDASFGFISWAASSTTTSGGNWITLSATSGTQAAPLVVGVNLQGLAAGTYSGNIQVSSPGATGTPKNIPVTLTLAPPPPVISTGGVQNNASYNRASLALAPGSIAAVFGTNLTNGTSCLPPACNPTIDGNGRLGTSMAGASITISGIAVPIFYATPNQLGIQIPAELGPGSVELRITTDGRQGSPTNFTVENTAPGIFTTTANGAGAGAITHADGAIVSAANPAHPGEVLVLYATGLGGTTPAVPTGALPTEPATANAAVVLSVDGIEVVPDYAGLAGCCAGLNQVNFRVPSTIRTNTTVTITINSGGRIGNPVTLQIGAAQ